MIVVAQRKPMQMLVDPQAKVVGDPLPGAGGGVIVDIAGDSSDDCDRQRCNAREQGDAERVLAEAGIFVRPVQPMRQMMVAQRIVDHELERPGSGKAHRDFDKHGGKHDREPAAIRPQKTNDQT